MGRSWWPCLAPPELSVGPSWELRRAKVTSCGTWAVSARYWTWPQVIACDLPAAVATVLTMDVTFTKLPRRRYRMAVVRQRGPELAARNGPGYDDYLPHDAVHFLVEAEAGLSGAAFGRIAAGRNNIFWAADPVARKRQARREAKRPPSSTEHADMAQSEQLASLCEPLWKLRVGQRSDLPDWFSSMAPGIGESPLVERILVRLDAFASCWHALPVGGSVTLSWPSQRAGSMRRARR